MLSTGLAVYFILISLISYYSISDESYDASKGKLPSVQLEPGEQYWVYGKNYSQKMKKDSVQVTFSWNDEENVHLFRR